jgi:hypothetical protein
VSAIESVNRITVTTILDNFKKKKIDRKKSRPFGPGFFTVGTVCDVVKSGENQPTSIRVRRLIKHGPDAYAIATGEWDRENSCDEAYDIESVTRIVRRAPGIGIAIGAHHYTQLPHRPQSLADFFIAETTAFYNKGRIKHRSRYSTGSPKQLVAALVAEMANSIEHVVDVQKMTQLLVKARVFHETEIDDDYVFSVGKKRLRKAIRRLFNKCLIAHRGAQADYDEKWNFPLEDNAVCESCEEHLTSIPINI